MTTTLERRRAMIWGSLVADAASMGLHWLYDQQRIRDIAPTAPEFRPPDPANYDGVPGYFAHPNRKVGDLSQYGEQGLVMLRALAGHGAYDRPTYQAQFQAHFGYGGEFVGYIDRATRDTLDNLARSEREETSGDDTSAQDYPGSDDVQVPALAKLPLLIARHFDTPGLPQMAESAVRVTNNNPTSTNFGAISVQLLRHALETGNLPDLRTLVDAADKEVSDAITPALSRLNETTETVTADIGMACYLTSCVPSIFHNLSTTTSFTDAVRTNIYAGGDNCGRAIVLGATLGAIYGIGGDKGIPDAWINMLTRKDEIAELIAQVVQ